jgi:hypothetical protein
MVKQRIVRDAVKTGLVALIGIDFMVVNSEPSFAQYRHQKSAICSSLVNAKGLKGDQRKGEYQKCMMDPQGYK